MVKFFVLRLSGKFGNKLKDIVSKLTSLYVNTDQFMGGGKIDCGLGVVNRVFVFEKDDCNNPSPKARSVEMNSCTYIMHVQAICCDSPTPNVSTSS